MKEVEPKRNEAKRSAAPAAPRRGDTSLHRAALKGHEVVVQLLLAAGAVVDAVENDGRGLGREFRSVLLRLGLLWPVQPPKLIDKTYPETGCKENFPDQEGHSKTHPFSVRREFVVGSLWSCEILSGTKLRMAKIGR